jgi:hypothetical protein
MPAPLDVLGALAGLRDEHLSRSAGAARSIQFALYDLLREEQALAAGAPPTGRSEAERILDLAQAACGQMVGLLAGRPDELLDSTRDGDWSLRDVLRHAMAVELRYGAGIEYSAARRDDDPVAAPAARMPCDRLAPPEPAFARSRTGGIAELLELLGSARAATDKRLTAIGERALARPSLWGTHELTVRMRLHQVAAHLTECVIQSEKCLAVEASTEARRILRHACAIRGAHERWSAPDARGELDARYRDLRSRLE